MKQQIKEWLSLQIAKRPRRTILATIILFNIVFVLLSAFIISSFSMKGTEEMNFFEAAFCTLTMILDPGCIQYVISDIGNCGVVISLACLLVAIVGMISFAGAIIGYTTNSISDFIEHSNTGTHRLEISDHIVILNWNTRASEIINDLLYCNLPQKVVVLVNGKKSDVEREITERLSDTIAKENEAIKDYCKDKGFFERIKYRRKHNYRQKVTFIIREGDVFSARQLKDLCLENAKTVIILGNDINNTVCQLEQIKMLEKNSRGNSQTIKTLMQVADITAAESSKDNQKIIVEITDEWTLDIVKKIIRCKQVKGKCNIVPLCVNQVLGQILSQFSLMPELNFAYRELFSNKGMTFYSKLEDSEVEEEFVRTYLENHKHAIPLTSIEKQGEIHTYYAAAKEKHIDRRCTVEFPEYHVKINKNYWLEQKNIIILGHNSKCTEIMKGFESFRNEWHYHDKDDEIVRIVVVDDEKNLQKVDYYREYPFVIKTVVADIYDRNIICNAIEEFVSEHEGDTSVLILSDDSSLNEDIDANALANLVYVQDIINTKKEEDPDFDENSIDIIVEIIDPKHHDIISTYSVNNVVISNRYISKMITQIGEKESLYDFYIDILRYDLEDVKIYDSKEIYVKKVSRFFEEVPGSCTAEQFIRAVYEASTELSLPKEKRNPTIALGYIKPGEDLVLFSGNQSSMKVELTENDKVVVFSNH